jgi:hypothetical protein
VINEAGYLTSVVERTHIEEKGGTIVYLDDHGVEHQLEEDALVSMNMWGFTPDYFDYSRESFIRFLQLHGQDLKSEFYIPTVVNELITQGLATCKVLQTPAKWFGVTYANDRPQVVLKINELIRKGVYPNHLWGK